MRSAGGDTNATKALALYPIGREFIRSGGGAGGGGGAPTLTLNSKTLQLNGQDLTLGS